MKRIFYSWLVVAGIVVLTGCATPPKASEGSAAVCMEQSEIEDYILSKHDAENNLVYFFIKKDGQNENAYAFILTEEMNESERMQCFVQYSTAGGIPGIRTTRASAAWFNDNSPVVIQDNANGKSMAAFSFPDDIQELWILVQNISVHKNEVNMRSFPLLDFKLSGERVQRYVINANADTADNVISSADRAEFEQCLAGTNFYATQAGTKFQPGYISGKDQYPQPVK